MKNVMEKEENNSQLPHMDLLKTHQLNSDGDVLFATPLKKRAFLIRFLILGVTITCVLIKTDFQHIIRLTQVLFMWVTMPNIIALNQYYYNQDL